MRLSVDIPDQKNALDSAIAKQFADIQRQLMALVKDQADSKKSMQEMMLDSMDSQRSDFLKAMEKLIGTVGNLSKSDLGADAIASSLTELKSSISAIPSGLKAALDKQYKSIQMKATPLPKTQITVKMPLDISDRLNSLENALVQGMKHSRNRTFGSNY